jgi:hypothetical protein
MNAGAMEIELFGNGGGTPVAGTDFDQVTADSADLTGGTLQIVVDSGYGPAVGDAFEILSASGGITGQFAAVNGQQIDVTREFAVQYNGSPAVTSVSLIVVDTAPLGDCDGDGDVDVADFLNFESCLFGPDGGLGSGCDCFDLDVDGDVDLKDAAIFQQAFTGSID